MAFLLVLTMMSLPTAPTGPASASSTVDVIIENGRPNPWHVEILPQNTVRWISADLAPVEVQARDGTPWCTLTPATPSCERTYQALGHHGYRIRSVPPSTSTPSTPTAESAFQFRHGGVNVLASLDVQVIEVPLDFSPHGASTAFDRSADLVFVSWVRFDGARVDGPGGYSCSRYSMGDFCEYSLSSLGIHRFTAYELRSSGPGAFGSLDVQIHGDEPTIAITSPAAGASVSGGFTITGTASAEAGADQVEVRVADRPWRAASGTTSWSLTVTDEGLPLGDVTIAARVTALDGQVVETSHDVDMASRGSAALSVSRLEILPWSSTDSGCILIVCATNLLVHQYPMIAVGYTNNGDEDVTSTLRLEYFEGGQWNTLHEQVVTAQAHRSHSLYAYWFDPIRFGEWVVRATIDADDDYAEADELDNERRRVARFPTFTGALPQYNGANTITAFESRYEQHPISDVVPLPPLAENVDGGVVVVRGSNGSWGSGSIS